MNLRLATTSNTAAIADLFTTSVHQIADNSYNPEELAAWAPTPPDIVQWN
jgi:hypothetical protein